MTAQETSLEDLPEPRHLAAALSDPVSRLDTLMTIAVVAHLLEASPFRPDLDLEEQVNLFRAERAWLDRLAARFPDVPLRSAVLDTSAWFLLIELDRHQLLPDPSGSPLGPETRDFVRQAFERPDARLAAAFLPELLLRLEPVATGLWQRVRQRAGEDETVMILLSRLNAEYFDPWNAAEPPSPVGRGVSEEIIPLAVEHFRVFAASSVGYEAPDMLRLKRLRFLLLSTLPDMQPFEARDASYLLRLVSAVDGLQDRKYLAFTETLLWLVSDLLQTWPAPVEVEILAASDEPLAGQTVAIPELHPGVVAEGPPQAEEVTVSSLAKVLAELLPQLSNAYARDFSDVDPRINANLAAAFDIVQNLQDGLPVDQQRRTDLISRLGDAIAQFVLMIPDMSFYFDQPVRRQISQEIDTCMSIVAATDPEGSATLSREQFDRCLASLVEMSDSLANSAELSGDTDGPYGTDQMERELELTPWQRINYALGYLHETSPGECQSPEKPLPNPLEWSALVTAISWFARQSPIYFQTPANENLILQMKQQGAELLQNMEQQVDCFSSAGPGISDPVSRGLADYRLALENLVAGIRETELAFREQMLAPGADIVLSGGTEQNTAYRPDGLIIQPCNSDRICEMTGQLETTRALIGLFPEPYLIADQIGLGKIEICYDNIQWVQRRADPVRADDPHVANYYGRLSFDLIGRYAENDATIDVFGSNFISPEEHHYLFAAASDEVLDDSCPMEWVGSKIVTPMSNESGIKIVPNRLTYLAAARSLPSQIINLNWNRGAEWRDWFVTGLGITRFEFQQDETFPDRINRRLLTLHRTEQSVIYGALLRSPSRTTEGDSASLYGETSALSTAKALVRMQINLFYPDAMLDSDEIRGSLEGTHALIDQGVLSRFRDSKVAVETISALGLSRFEDFRSNWGRQPEAVRRTGSASVSVALAIARLNSLYLEFFKPAEQWEEKTVISVADG